MHINWKKEIATVPNLLSFFRLALIPVYVRIYLNSSHPNHYLQAASVLALSCLTDAADGMIARKYDMISNLGKLLDPLADKLTQFTLILCLSARYPVLISVLVLLVVKELFQLTAFIINLRKGKALPGALAAGKACTAVLFVSLIFLVLIPGLNYGTVTAIALLNTGFLTFSFASYIMAYYGKNTKLKDLPAE